MKVSKLEHKIAIVKNDRDDWCRDDSLPETDMVAYGIFCALQNAVEVIEELQEEIERLKG